MKIASLSRRALAGFVPLLAGAGVQAQTWPTRPIRLVVPWPPGGVTDIQARILGDELARLLGRPVVIDNKAGAAGRIGTEAVAKAAPDGYTLLLLNANHPILAATDARLPFDPLADVTPIARLSNTCMALVVANELPVRSVSELVAYAKARPGKLNYASIGNGSAHHLLMERFKLATGVDLVHVPYRGEAPAIMEMIAGQVQAFFMAGAKPYIDGGKVRALGVTAPTAWFNLPGLPPISDSVPGFVFQGWNGLAGPGGLPVALVERLSEAVTAAIGTERLRAALLEQGYEPVTDTPAAFARRIRDDIAAWRDVTTKAGLKFDQ
jgi:tripartite-type tricarboxylate transporter receptor subunit TctC